MAPRPVEATPRRRVPREVPGLRERRRLTIAMVGFSVVLLVGWIGYQLFGARPLDALYMTIITVGTVGFREVIELTDGGKLFTIVLIVAGVGTVSYALITAFEYIVEGHYRRSLERRRMERSIQTLTDHVIVCGYGRVGRHLVGELAQEGVAFVVVDTDDEAMAELAEEGVLRIDGDATEEHVLEEAGLARARAVVACVNSDADNVLVTLTAKGLRPDLTVIARTKADENEAKLRRAGADRVIAPTTIGGRRIAQLLTRPTVADFLDVTGRGGEFSLEEVPIASGSGLDGTTLKDASIRERYGCTILAIRRAGDPHLDTHPPAETVLHAGDVLVVIGAEAETAAMRRRFASGL